MKRTAAPLAALALLALAACQPRRPGLEDYYAILPELVRAVEADARQNAAGRPAEGPLFLDLESFAGGGWQLTKQRTSRDSVWAAIAHPGARPARPDSALVLEDSMSVGGRFVREYGVFERLHLVKWEPGEIAVTIASYTTDRRRWPTDVCERVLRVTFRRQGEGEPARWTQSDTEVRLECDDPR
jgi:hypothetical protein